MQLQTFVTIPATKIKIDLTNPILLIGSCFSDEIGNLLEKDKFLSYVNPFGTIFNPISCFTLLEMCLKNTELGAETYLKKDELYFNYLLHSDFWAYQLPDLQEDIQHCKQKIQNFFANTEQKIVIITLGTAFVYELLANQQIVANCHKQSSKLFAKKLLTVDEIVKKFATIYALFPANTHIIFTLSPVRHLKDTLLLNSLSKSILRVACAEIEQNFTNISYFPSYEILLDELRDYRFYTSDMLHPSPQAVGYIYQKFCHSYMNPNTLAFLEKWKKISQKLAHHSFHPETAAHQHFLQNLLQELQAITEVNLEQEIENVKEKLQQK